MTRAKFIVTLGPSSLSTGTIESMSKLGSSAFRINTAHVEPEYIGRAAKILKQVKENIGLPITMLVDLKGPEIRLNFKEGDKFRFELDKSYEIGIEDRSNLFLNQKNIFKSLKSGDLLLVNDGIIHLSVNEVSSDSISVKSMDEGLIRKNARVNIPGKTLNLGSLTDRDREFVKEGIKEGAGFFALSFVQTSKNVEELRSLIKQEGGEQFIVSKIETYSGVKNIDGILKTSDMIMIARGDLGVEMPLEEIALTQKGLIRKAHSYGIPTIVATQMLESMVNNDSPTRAEISDITNALMDNADILMLSDETAIGKFPVDAVKVLKTVTEYVESKIKELPEPEEFYGNPVAYSLAKSAKIISQEIDAGILVLTRSGNTVKMISSLRPKGKIYAVTPNRSLEDKFGLYNNVYPVHIDKIGNNLNDVLEEVRKTGKFKEGEILVVTSGEGYFSFGGTNDIRVHLIGKFLGRGYSRGKSVKGLVTYKSTQRADILITDSEYINSKRSFKAIIFEGSPLNSTVEKLAGSTECVVVSAIFKERPKEGEFIFVEGKTGIIHR